MISSWRKPIHNMPPLLKVQLFLSKAIFLFLSCFLPPWLQHRYQLWKSKNIIIDLDIRTQEMFMPVVHLAGPWSDMKGIISVIVLRLQQRAWIFKEIIGLWIVDVILKNLKEIGNMYNLQINRLTLLFIRHPIPKKLVKPLPILFRPQWLEINVNLQF